MNSSVARYFQSSSHFLWTSSLNLEESMSGSYMAGRMKEWICDYLEPKNQYDVDETAGSREPFVHNAHWYVYKNSFSRWCYNHQGYLEGIEKTELDLVLIGAELKKFNPKKRNKENRSIHPGGFSGCQERRSAASLLAFV